MVTFRVTITLNPNLDDNLMLLAVLEITLEMNTMYYKQGEKGGHFKVQCFLFLEISLIQVDVKIRTDDCQ